MPPLPPGPSQPIYDQFAQRTVTGFKPYLLCGPSGIGTHYVATLDQAQETPPTGSPATGSCTAILDSTQTSLAISCTHNVVASIAAHIHMAPVGVRGQLLPSP